MKILLAILQLAICLHIDQRNGIIFMKDKPVRIFKNVEKVYLDTIIRSPRELLNYGELNFPDSTICYSSRRHRQTQTISCGEFLDIFDKRILDFAKTDIVNHESENRIQKRFVVTAAVFGISVAITSLLGYFFGKAHTETQADILAKEMKEERARMANMTRAAELSKETIEEMALEMRENGHLATAMSPDVLLKHYIFMAHNWDITTENNKNGPEFINELIKKQLERIQKSHSHLLDGHLPIIYLNEDLHKNTMTAKCLSIQYEINEITKEFCQTFTNGYQYKGHPITYHGLSMTKNENGKIKEVIMSASVIIPILEKQLYENYKIINLGTFDGNNKINLETPENILINGSKIDGFNTYECEMIGSSYYICHSNVMIPNDECVGKILNEDGINHCILKKQPTRHTCSIYENSDFLAVSMISQVRISEQRKIQKFEILKKDEELTFKCPHSRRRIHVRSTKSSKVTLEITLLNSTSSSNTDRMDDIDIKLTKMNEIIKNTNKTVDYHSNALNQTLNNFKNDVKDTAESIPEAIENQLEALFMLFLPYLVTFGVIVVITLLACCIIPCVYHKMKKLMFTSHVSFHPDNSQRDSQSAI